MLERKDYILRTIDKAVEGTPGTARDDDSAAKETTQAQMLITIIESSGVKFFQSDNGDVYAAIFVNNHAEVWTLNGKNFSTWASGVFYKSTGIVLRKDTIQQAISIFEAKAKFDSPETITLHTRVAGNSVAIWYDLTNPDWQTVKVIADGWELVDNSPILFKRHGHQTAQVIPRRNGDVRKILRHINLAGYKTLFLCWLISCFVPGIPHTMAIFHGEKGAAKTTITALTKMLIDPSALDNITMPKDFNNLILALQKHWYLPFDNVSSISTETSDALCRAISGSGIQQRKLYTDSDDIVYTFMRCLAINGINNVATRPDLLDRSILIELERIAEADRRELSEVLSAFEADRADILGGIFNTLSKAMAIYPTVKLGSLPRMADFTRWGYAIGEALGGLGQEFLDQYTHNRKVQNDEVIASDPVATLLVDFMRERESWTGRFVELFNDLYDLRDTLGKSIKFKTFPPDPTRLSKWIRGILSNLEAVGLNIEMQTKRDGCHITIVRKK